MSAVPRPAFLIAPYRRRARPARPAFFLLLLAAFSAPLFSLTYVSSCGTFSAPNEEYVLTQNISGSGNCLSFDYNVQNSVIDCQGHSITGSGGASGRGIQNANTVNFTVKNCVISNCYQGLYMMGMGSVMMQTVRNVTLYNNSYGLYLAGIINATVSDITVHSNFPRGIHVSASYNNSFANVTAYNNTYGIWTQGGSDVNYFSNVLSYNNTYGTYVNARYHNFSNITYFNNTVAGLYLYGTATMHNFFTNITSYGNQYGIFLNGTSGNNTITGSRAYNNSLFQISAGSSSGNLIYNCIFNASGAQGLAYGTGANSWNTTKTAGTNILGGPYIGGNYYSNYTGIDSDGDGIGDTGYPIGASSSDYLPLVLYSGGGSGTPGVALNSPAQAALLNSSPVTLNWTPSNFSSNPTCNVTRNAALLFSGTCTNGTSCTSSNDTPDGTYYWNATCYSGEQSAASATGNFSVDATAPAITINSPAADSTTNSPLLEVNLTVADANLDYTNISIYNSTGARVNSTVSLSGGNQVVQLGVPSDGVYNITAASYDLYGNANTTANPNVTVDALQPSVSVQSPANATYNASSVSLNFTVSDSGSGTGECWYRLDGGANTSLPACGNTTITSLSDGSHSITVYANDSAGNTGSAQASFSVSTPKTGISLAVRNQDLRPSYLNGIFLNGGYVPFDPPLYFAPGERKIVSFSLTNSYCSYSGQLVQFDVVILYYQQGMISGLAEAGTVPLIAKCS